jgi:hypothetical protein
MELLTNQTRGVFEVGLLYPGYGCILGYDTFSNIAHGYQRFRGMKWREFAG